jgi:hypothetical protein
MPLKWTFFYNQTQQGWTETYFSNDSQPQPAVDALTTTQLSNFIGFRAPLTGIYGIRATDLTNPRNSYFRPLNNVYLAPSLPYTTAPEPDPASTDLVVRVYDNSGKRKNVFLRGLRDLDIQRDATGFRQISAPFQTALSRWFNQCSKLGFVIRSLVPPPLGGLAWQNVLQAQASLLGANFTELVVPAIPAWAVPQAQIRFQGVNTNDLPGFPKTTIIAATDALTKTVTIPVRWRSPAAVSTPKLRFTLIAYSFSAWQGFQPGNFVSHKTGRPFGAQRGRSRVAVRSR